MIALTTHTFGNQREKEKKKRLKETQTSDRKLKQRKKQDHLKEGSLGRLRQRQRLDTTETKQAHHKRANHQSNQGKTHTRAPPAHMKLPHEPKHTPLDLCMLK
jgi:hypothetical protein